MSEAAVQAKSFHGYDFPLSAFPNQPRFLPPEEWHEVTREARVELEPPLELAEWDDSIPVVFKRYRGMRPPAELAEWIGKRKKKLVFRYGPSKEFHRYNTLRYAMQWNFYAGRMGDAHRFVVLFVEWVLPRVGYYFRSVARVMVVTVSPEEVHTRIVAGGEFPW
ncbi:hypothetical protein [Palaeococcus ferrophilus]|uniref:hypothetical protein n=1 Tax=Palaeococcus ferrophilus TaxID=83868 RepID=UPI00064E6351|nr:hypothetical protein [Palaeococcus ferrophilus]